MQYPPGAENATADDLSRMPLPDVLATLDSSVMILHNELIENLPVQADEIARTTAHEVIFCQVLSYIQDGWPNISGLEGRESIKPYFILQSELTVQHDFILRGFRVVIPPGIRNRILLLLHETHTGMIKTIAVARSRV